MGMHCGIYEHRPLVCRIYPAEISPLVELVPAQKVCPPDAWTPGLAPLVRSGKLLGEGIERLVLQSRDTDEGETTVKQQVCAILGIDRAATWNEGFAVHKPDRGDLLSALNQASRQTVMTDLPTWQFVSNRRKTIATLLSIGALGSLVDPNGTGHFEYLSFFPTFD
ncbi:hypothetical protein SB861_03160 [Paraburkholderia sp. SIMBA_049]